MAEVCPARFVTATLLAPVPHPDGPSPEGFPSSRTRVSVATTQIQLSPLGPRMGRPLQDLPSGCHRGQYIEHQTRARLSSWNTASSESSIELPNAMVMSGDSGGS